MPKENLSQRVLLELLTDEIEILKASTEHANKLLPELVKHQEQIGRYVDKIENTKVPIDPSALDRILDNTLKFQRKALIWVLAMALTCSTAIAGAVVFYKKAQEMEEIARTWYDTAVEYGYKSEEN